MNSAINATRRALITRSATAAASRPATRVAALSTASISAKVRLDSSKNQWNPLPRLPLLNSSGTLLLRALLIGGQQPDETCRASEKFPIVHGVMHIAFVWLSSCSVMDVESLSWATFFSILRFVTCTPICPGEIAGEWGGRHASPTTSESRVARASLVCRIPHQLTDTQLV